MKAEVVWRLITAQKWPNISGFAWLFGVSLTRKQHQRCWLNVSENWDLIDWRGRWCHQQKQRNLLDGAGMGRKSHFCMRSMTALSMALDWRMKESSLWSCWTCSCTWLALFWLYSLLSQPCKAPHPNSNHMSWDRVMLGREQSNKARGVGRPRLLQQT